MPRYRPLGGFRFGLAMLVVAQHFQHLLAPADRALFARMGFGAIAVAVFFVVSGFVVTEANATYYRGRAAAFFENRLLRLVPPYMAALLLSIAVHAALWRQGSLVLWDFPNAAAPVTVLHVLAGVAGLVPGLHRAAPDAFEFIPFAWSLRMEMAFYSAVTAVLLATPAAGRALPGIALAVALVAAFVFVRAGRPGLLSCAPMFILGVAFCLACRRGGTLRCGFLAAALPVAWLGFESWGQHGSPVLPAQLLVLALLLALFCILAVGRIPGGWQRFDTRLGDVSYPLYLNHYVVGIALTSAAAPCRWLYGAGVILALAVSAVMARTMDGWLAGRRNRLRRGSG